MDWHGAAVYVQLYMYVNPDILMRKQQALNAAPSIDCTTFQEMTFLK